MARKKSRGPALYEVIGKRSAAPVGRPMPAPPSRRRPNRAVHKQVPPVRSQPAAETSGSSANGTSRWLMPGSAIRIPTGVILAASVLVIVLLLMIYMIGHRRGRDVAIAQMNVTTGQADAGARAVDRPVVVDPLATAETTISVNPYPGDAGRESLGSNYGDSKAAWAPISSDPRVSGLSYFVLAEWHGQEISALAEFCRTRGLETYVVPGKNARFNRVIVVPGFESAQRNDPWVLKLENDIHEAGRAWKRAGGGSDLSDAYPILYRTGR